MKKLSKEILKRDAKCDIGQEVLQAIREVKAGGGRRFTVQVTEATEARLKLGLSQADFAAMLGVSTRCKIGSRAGANRAVQPRLC
jgi:putative transcriptional regulator